MNEREWVRALEARLAAAGLGDPRNGWTPRVQAGCNLPYAHEIWAYSDDYQPPRIELYETDLLIYDVRDGGDWIPRVIIEVKKGGVTTHDALTYSAKAEAHKRVHPYLRYGILVGEFDTAVPGRLLRHGAYFDFMMAWGGAEPTEGEWHDCLEVLRDELMSSRLIQQMLTENRSRDRTRFRVIQRPLKLYPSAVTPPTT